MQSNKIKSLDSLFKKRPETVFSLGLYCLGVSLDLWAAQQIFQGFLLNALVAHCLSAFILPWPLSRIMPQDFRPSKTILLLFFFFCLFIPVVSGFLLLLLVTVGLRQPKPSNVAFLEFTGLPSFSDKNAVPSNLDFADKNVYSILKFSTDESERVKAVLSTRYMQNKNAVPVLQLALSDCADEVRLLAFALLDKKEKEFDSIIHRGLAKLKSDDLNPEEFSSIHYSIAETYWELSYLGLAKGRARIHVLNSAKQHVSTALKHRKKDAAMYVLQARVMTRLGNYKQARSALDKAKIYGMSMAKLALLQAELAFELRQFDTVRKHVRQIDTTAQTNMIQDGMVNQWI